MKKKDVLKGIALALPLGLVGFMCLNNSWVLNLTESVPIGLYRSVNTPTQIPKGRLVTVCLRNDAQGQLASSLASFSSGNCSEGMGRLIKVVRGTPHDTVHWSSEGVFVNGQYIEHSKPYEKDSHGHDMPRLRETRFLGDDEYVLMGIHPKSFDSRYLGVFHRSQIQSIIEPIWTKAMPSLNDKP